MGLYINHNSHQGIFKNKEDISAPNQGFFIRNHMEEMIKAQEKVNASMEKAIANMNSYQKQQDGIQQGKWLEMQEHLQRLLDMNTKHEQVEGHVMKQLLMLDEKNELLSNMIKENTSDENNKMKQMHASQQEILSKLKGYETEAQRLIGKIDEQALLHQQLAKRVSEQENSQGEMLDRMENQEALTQKMLRQFDHFRSSLFERTAFLAEKIEESAKFTSAYMTKLLSGKDQSSELFKQ